MNSIIKFVLALLVTLVILSGIGVGYCQGSLDYIRSLPQGLMLVLVYPVVAALAIIYTLLQYFNIFKRYNRSRRAYTISGMHFFIFAGELVGYIYLVLRIPLSLTYCR